jgi:fatty acid desaturase (delta-4 desaturase)
LYASVLFCFLWISIQFQDLASLLNSQFFDVSFKGTKSLEITFAVFLKVVHFFWIVVVPFQIHGFSTMIVPWCTVFGFGGFMLSAMFIVSHNVDEAKVNAITIKEAEAGKGDWAKTQIETSTSWGGAIGSFMSGGLNLQIEHHLFPCMAHSLYPEVQKIVKEECAKAGIHYTGYGYLLPNFIDHIKFLYTMGNPDEDVAKAKAGKAE